MEPRLHLVDIIIGVYVTIISALVVIFYSRIEAWWVYLAYHAIVFVMIGLILHAHVTYGGRFWRAVRYWFPIYIIMASFRELHFLIRQIHPFEPDYPWDAVLTRIDQALLGTDLKNLLDFVTWPAMADVLSVCYWMYFPMPVILGIVLYRSGKLREFRYGMAGLFLGWYISYIGYILVPAVGPHILEPARHAALDGVLTARPLHQFLLFMEWEMPSAFPSGHTLVTLLTLIYAYRFERRLFRIFLPIGSGLILATMYLRYHYLIDVLAGAALVPAVLVLGRFLFDVRENRPSEEFFSPGF